MSTSLPRLIEDLGKAAGYFRSLGDTTDLFHDESGAEFADLVSRLASKLQDGSISDDELKRLWLIFAPTCAWDDFRGDVDLGQRIFDSLQEIYGHRIDRVLNQKAG